MKFYRTLKDWFNKGESQFQRNEPLIGTPLPPWEMIAMDYVKSQGKWYKVVVDYYSRHLDVQEMRKTTSRSAIKIIRVSL